MTPPPLPDVQPIAECLCFDFAPPACLCSDTEKQLRQWAGRPAGAALMSTEQRAWCLAEVRAAGDATAQPADLETFDDAALAATVLFAWRDVARDHGLL
jgi:hypothetical protein